MGENYFSDNWTTTMSSKINFQYKYNKHILLRIEPPWSGLFKFRENFPSVITLGRIAIWYYKLLWIGIAYGSDLPSSCHKMLADRAVYWSIIFKNFSSKIDLGWYCNFDLESLQRPSPTIREPEYHIIGSNKCLPFTLVISW